MSKPLPTLFVSHGAPDLLLTEHAVLDVWRDTAARLPRPEAVVVVSAHWVSGSIGITAAESPTTIHDFGGFPDALYDIRYPAPGNPALAAEIETLLLAEGLGAHRDGTHGLDHGAWVPLSVMYPGADIPVVQVALPAGGLELCLRLGAALAPLRERDVLILGSGGSVHNLREMNRLDRTDEWAARFEAWLQQAVETGDPGRLVKPEHHPREMARAHPTLEHFAPLPVVWAAGASSGNGRRIHHGFTHGNLGMSIYLFA